MKISASTYSFMGAIRDGRMTQFDCVAKAKELGLDGIEYTDLQVPDGMTEAEFAVKVREESERCGVPIVSHTIHADFLTGCDGDLDAEVERLKKKVDIGAILGVKQMRHDATYGFAEGTRKFQGFDQVLPRLVDGIRRVTEYAATKGIRTMTENHGFFAQDSDRVEKMVNAVASENYGLLVDIGNFTCADEDPAIAVGRVAPYAFHVHVKDFHIKSGMGPNPGAGFFRSRNGNYLRGAIIGQGNVPVLQCLTALKKAGYDGYFSIEFEGVEDCLYGIATCRDNLKRYLSMIEV